MGVGEHADCARALESSSGGAGACWRFDDSVRFDARASASANCRCRAQSCDRICSGRPPPRARALALARALIIVQRALRVDVVVHIASCLKSLRASFEAAERSRARVARLALFRWRSPSCARAREALVAAFIAAFSSTCACEIFGV